MKWLPSIDISNNSDQMSPQQSLTIVIIVYISVCFYTALLLLELHNLYKYIYLQKKYKIFPLSLFYALSIPCTLIRIFSNIWILEITKYSYIWVLWSPAVLKLCISFSQILIMIELAIRIEQSCESPEQTRSYKFFNSLVFTFRVIVSIICTVILVIWNYVCIQSLRRRRDG